MPPIDIATSDDTELTEMTNKVFELETQINSIRNSRSWKLANGIAKVAAKILRRK